LDLVLTLLGTLESEEGNDENILTHNISTAYWCILYAICNTSSSE
jgi:hypothetical protein